MMIKFSHRSQIRLVSALVVIGLCAGFVGSAEAAKPSDLAGAEYVGACNMLHDATMMTIPMVRNNPDGDIFSGNGNLGMWHAVDVSGCGLG